MRYKLTLLLVAISALCVDAQSLKVMTYNIRLNIASDGVNAWPNRNQKVAEFIKKINPDVFGVQEALHDQMQDLATVLTDYTYLGVGRDDGKEKGEYTAIFYKKNRLRVEKSSSFWLSETPDKPGSIGWDAAITRMATWAELEDVQSKQKFLFVTTHFDHMGKQARLMSASTITMWVKGYMENAKLPVIFCGDLNIEPTEEPYQTVMQVLKDARPLSTASGTFCGFEKDKIPCKVIDYIFHSLEWKVETFEVLQDNDGTHYPSDHLPVVATLSLR